VSFPYEAEYIDILELIKKLSVYIENQKAQYGENCPAWMVGRDYAYLVPDVVKSCTHKEVRLVW
jgi:hypothetical protein